MATKKKEMEDLNEEVELPVEDVKEDIKVPVKKVVPVKREKLMKFSRYAAVKGIKSHHVAGMKAFVDNIDALRTKEEWDSLFETY